MAAPALVMIAPGSIDAGVCQVAHELMEMLSERRPDLIVRTAYLGHAAPTPMQVLESLAAEGVQEAALVPLELSHAIDPSPAIDELVALARRSFPAMNIVASRPTGPEANLLGVLDERLRSALSAARCLELDGLVLSAESTGDVRGSALLARRARQWSTHHRLPVTIGVADGSGPSVGQAIAGLRAQGRRHIAVGSFFLTADAPFRSQADQALRLGAVAVSEPIGAASEMIDLVLARYAYASMDLLDFEQREFSLDAFAEGADWAEAQTA